MEEARIYAVGAISSTSFRNLNDVWQQVLGKYAILLDFFVECKITWACGNYLLPSKL
jgi:hypothetical protein